MWRERSGRKRKRPADAQQPLLTARFTRADNIKTSGVEYGRLTQIVKTIKMNPFYWKLRYTLMSE